MKDNERQGDNFMSESAVANESKKDTVIGERTRKVYKCEKSCCVGCAHNQNTVLTITNSDLLKANGLNYSTNDIYNCMAPKHGFIVKKDEFKKVYN